MREFLEIEDPDAFIKISQAANFVIRVDPFIFIYIYGLIFYIDLGKLETAEVKKIFQNLRDKLVIVKNVEKSRSIYEFLKEKLGKRMKKP
jgi:hypothetical protein